MEQREAARQTLRGFIDRIVIPPGDGLLAGGRESRGDADSRRRSDGSARRLSVMVVAGAGFEPATFGL